MGLVVVLVMRGEGTTNAVPVGQSLRLKLAPLASLGALYPPGVAGALGPEGVPIPRAPVAAASATEAGGSPVGAIECSSSEQTLFHIHARLTVFVNGAARLVPLGIGIPRAQAESTSAGPFVGSGSCFYWLHTHAADGIIHIESPIHRLYTLGNFFDIWGQPLSSTQVGPAPGLVTALCATKGTRVKSRSRPTPRSSSRSVARSWPPTSSNSQVGSDDAAPRHTPLLLMLAPLCASNASSQAIASLD